MILPCFVIIGSHQVGIWMQKTGGKRNRNSFLPHGDIICSLDNNVMWKELLVFMKVEKSRLIPAIHPHFSLFLSLVLLLAHSSQRQ